MGARPDSSGLPTGPIFTGPRDFSGSTVVDPRDRVPRGFRGPIATGPRTRGSRGSRTRKPRGFRGPIATGPRTTTTRPNPDRGRASRSPRNRVNRPLPPARVDKFEELLSGLEGLREENNNIRSTGGKPTPPSFLKPGGYSGSYNINEFQGMLDELETLKDRSSRYM